jgi:hypothetical protein
MSPLRRRGYGQVPGKETTLAGPLARLLTTPDMSRTFAESYLDTLDAAGRADPRRPRIVYGSFDQTRYRRHERTEDLTAWHEMLLDRFAGTPKMSCWTGSPSAGACRVRAHLPAREDRGAPR